MLSCQLCVLDDKTDSKSKWVKKKIVWLCCPDYQSSLFCEDSNPWWFAATMAMHAMWMYHILTQGIRIMKTFTMYIKISPKKKSSFECWDHCD